MSPKTPTPIRPKPPEVEEQIRQRAHQLYEERGRLEGFMSANAQRDRVNNTAAVIFIGE